MTASPGQVEPELAAVITNYQGLDVLPDTLRSLRHVTPRPGRVLVVDDGSTDRAPERLRAEFPEIEWLELGRNSGGRLNVVRNRGIEAVDARYVLLLDHDVEAEPDAVQRLLEVLRARPDASGVTPRFVDREDPRRIYSDGQDLHFLGLSVIHGSDALASERPASALGPPAVTFGGGRWSTSRSGITAASRSSRPTTGRSPRRSRG